MAASSTRRKLVRRTPLREGLFFRCDLSALRAERPVAGHTVSAIYWLCGAPAGLKSTLRRPRCLDSTTVRSKPHPFAAIMTHALTGVRNDANRNAPGSFAALARDSEV